VPIWADMSATLFNSMKRTRECVFSQLLYINLLSTVTHGFKDSGGDAARSVSGAATIGSRCMGQTKQF
jgi:hypothetical protein